MRWGSGVVAAAIACLSGGCEAPIGYDEPVSGAPVTWISHIEPLVQRSCAPCHGEGGAAPTRLDTWPEAAADAALLAAVVSRGRMPPPVADEGCRAAPGSDPPRLSDDERALFVAWAAQGAPLGEGTLPVHPAATPATGDLLVRMPPWMPSFDRGDDDIQCAVVTPPAGVPAFVTGWAPAVSGEVPVLRMGVFLDPNGDTRTVHGLAPFPCAEDDRAPGGALYDSAWDWEEAALWGQGGAPARLPGGVAVPPGADLILQVHVTRDRHTAAGAVDRSGLWLDTAAEVERVLAVRTIASADATVPPSYTPVERQADAQVPGLPGEMRGRVWGVTPESRRLGVGHSLWVEHRSGEHTCLIEGGFSFKSQQSYLFDAPVTLWGRDRLAGRCAFDNSIANPDLRHVPPVEARDGEGVDDERCRFHLWVEEIASGEAP